MGRRIGLNPPRCLASSRTTAASNGMDCFDRNTPAMATLATEYAVFNHYHAAVPGPTKANRFYASSATSHGSGTNNNIRLAEG